jgi:UDP-2-acetamido-2,6-beta-L-arabino-hexul-4-ose reductase
VKVLITGADGFIGSNLRLRLAARAGTSVLPYTRQSAREVLPRLVAEADAVVHLAGVNRPQDPSEFESGNAALSRELADTVAAAATADGRRIPVIFASSTQAAADNPYGISKRRAEACIVSRAQHGVPVYVYRLPNVFGKWCRPNYNSAVATFCHNIARGLAISINDPAAPVTLVHIDDVVDSFLAAMEGHLAPPAPGEFARVEPQYTCTVGELAGIIEGFHVGRQNLTTAPVGTGLLRALYATYVSYLPTSAFSYPVPKHSDARGEFVEMLKTVDSGQFSYFTAHPGVTRGGHYHHSKTEKFLVLRGSARFRFKHMETGETHELHTSGESPTIVETVPGWTHDVTNVGGDELIVMLWANEVFDRERPDTYACPL